jgi:parallel beta-helix repeat protein
MGIQLMYSSHCNLLNNTISNHDYGIIIGLGSNHILVSNHITNNYLEGLRLGSSSNNTLINNTFSFTEMQYGVHCFNNASYNLFYQNVFRNNTGSNAYVDSACIGNQWNTSNIGNRWDDYSGSGTYSISGAGGGIDYHPYIDLPETISPAINHPSDIIYESGTTKNNITWTSSDVNPSHYILFRNGSAVEISFWDGGPIVVNIDGLSLGSYYFTIGVYDTSGNRVYDIVYVTVKDTTNPFISSPINIEYIEGTIGNSILWIPNDANPSHYVVYQDDTEIVSRIWDGSSIEINVDGLDLGVYNYTLMVNDTSGHWAFDTVIVTVLPQPTTSTTTITSISTTRSTTTERTTISATESTTSSSTPTTTVSDGGLMVLLVVTIGLVSLGLIVVISVIMKFRR